MLWFIFEAISYCGQRTHTARKPPESFTSWLVWPPPRTKSYVWCSVAGTSDSKGQCSDIGSPRHQKFSWEAVHVTGTASHPPRNSWAVRTCPQPCQASAAQACGVNEATWDADQWAGLLSSYISVWLGGKASNRPFFFLKNNKRNLLPVIKQHADTHSLVHQIACDFS